MSQDLSQDEVNELANLLAISQKAKAREALCIKIGISYYKELGFVYESSEDSFVRNLISYLNEIGNAKAICYLCCQELTPIFKNGKRESFLKEIAVKLDCNQELGHDYQKPKVVEEPVYTTPTPDPEHTDPTKRQTGEAKSQSKKIIWLLLGFAVIGIIPIIGLFILQSKSAPPPTPAPQQTSVVPGPVWNNDTVFEVRSETCPPGSTLVTFLEALDHRDTLSQKLGQWDIARLANGGSMDGPGYHSKIREEDKRPLGNALCKRLK